MEQFGNLLVEQIPRLRRYARALTGDVHLADDLVQDALGRAWSRMQQWQPDSNLRAWLFTIMHNLYVNNVRRDRHQAGWETTDGKEPADTRPQDQDRAMTLEDLEKGLAQLPADQRLFPKESVSIRQVRDKRTGGLWRRSRSAEVLLLGDSFSNIFSLPDMGWGNYM